MSHLEIWERNEGNEDPSTMMERNAAPQASKALINNTCEECEKGCESAAGLRIHTKRMHEVS